MVNILIIITPFLPAQTPNTLRWLPIIENMIENGYKVTVLTSKWSNRGIIENVRGIKTYRFGHNTLKDYLYDLFNIEKRRSIVGTEQVFKTNYFASAIEWLISKLWRKNYWPDGSVLFLRAAKKKVISVVQEERITHVISVGLPFSAHLIARDIKEKLPNIKWLMDVQDPFSISDQFWVNNFSKYALKNISEEETCLSLADHVIFTNDIVTKIYAEMFPEYNKKYIVIPPLFKLPAQPKPYNKKSKLKSPKVNMAYFGSFYEGVRSPFMFLKLIDYIYINNKVALDKMHFHFYGELNKFSSPIFLLFDHLSDYITHHGFIAHEKMLDHVMKYDILLNFGNTTNYHLPSKVVEFLFYNKPVMNFISVNDDSSKMFLQDKIDVFSIKLDSSNLKTNADEFLNFISRNYSNDKVNIDAVTPYLPEGISQQYIDILKK